jgi:cytochrome c oxidase cbb3-type subunit IV
MDINDARVAVTLLGLVLFLGIMVWTWSNRHRRGFEEAAHLPFVDADAHTEPAGEKQ